MSTAGNVAGSTTDHWGSADQGIPILDYLIDTDGGDIVVYDRGGNEVDRETDFGDAFNDTLTLMNHEGILGIKGGEVYGDGGTGTYAVQPMVTGTGSPLEKQLEIMGIGGGVWPILDASTGIHGIQYERGANVHTHRLHIQAHTAGNGRCLYGAETAAQNAYLENPVWWARFGDLKLEGGTSGVPLWEMAMPEQYDIYGLIYLAGGAGVHGILFTNSATSEFPYGEGVNTAMMAILTNGANTTNLEFAGNATGGHELMHVDWRGCHMLLLNSTSSAGTIAVKTSYLESSYIGGIHFEAVEYGIQQNTGTWNVIFDGGMSFCGLNANTGAFFDMNALGNCTIQNFTCFFGGANRPIIDDENDNLNSPHKYSGLVYYGTGGGTPVDDLGANAMLETYPDGKYYRRRGAAAAWP